MRFRHVLAAMSLMASTPLAAATLIVDANGNLAGATGVDVAGTMYDVAFTNGSCAALFGGCDESTDFQFTELQTQTAAQALLDQVFLDGILGAFDTQYGLTVGCEGAVTYCVAAIPYGNFAGTNFLASAALNNITLEDDYVGGAGGSINNNFSNTSFTWALFTPVTAVPEPSTWAMMLLGFGSVGLALRRRRRFSVVAQLA